MYRRFARMTLFGPYLVAVSLLVVGHTANAADAPMPLLKSGHAVDWWFVFKFNGKSFPGCGEGITRSCAYGGDVQTYKAFGQQFVYSSSEDATLQQGNGCAGGSDADPLGATFAQVYNGAYNFLIWNDQFYDDPKIKGCTTECGSPWGHSKGMLSWNDDGEGLVLQVSTPSWPACGSKKSPRKTDGNTLGCVKDNNVEVSQHFFALKLTKNDVMKVLGALQNASVVTDPKNPQVARLGGPPDIQQLAKSLGVKSKSKAAIMEELSTGVDLISKPSGLNVPPWQMVSSFLKGVSLRAATWWAKPEIPSTTAASKIACWSNTLGKPGAVEIATSGQWSGNTFGLTGGSGPEFNHAKIGVSTSGPEHYVIFGDMNQQGALSDDCASSQNGRGGMFYVIDNQKLSESVASLIQGESAPVAHVMPTSGTEATRKRPRAGRAE
ncbi:MAG: deoxyribonuclease II family protein [Bryobacteraceae bacterium]